MEQQLTVSEITERASRAFERAYLYEDQDSYRSGVIEALRAILDGVTAVRASA